MQENQQITFLSDGADTVRELQYFMHPESEHILDWFHLTMRLTVLGQFAKGLVKSALKPGEAFQKTLFSIKWYLWHGNVDEALDLLEDCEEVFYALKLDDVETLRYKNKKKLVTH